MRKLLALALASAVLTGGAWLASVLQQPAPLPDDAAIEEMATGAQAELVAAYPENSSGLVRRDAHAKAHGCVKAIFRTDPELPADLRVGTFATPGQVRKTLIRYSNGALHPGPDSLPDGRGMAVKLIDADPGKPGVTPGAPPHDLLMINYPRFFVPGIKDYRNFVRVHAMRGGQKEFMAYFLPGWNPFNWRLRDMTIAFANATREIESPLRTNYFSMTPYAFGAGRAVKYVARPCVAAASVSPVSKDPDYLRKALIGELAAAPACFELLIQEKPEAANLDDATQEWTTPLRRVGQIHIPAQSVDAPARDAACENLSFNPFHAPADQAPIGEINRIRAVVYPKIAAYRMKRNNVTPTDPERAWDSF